MAITYNKKGTKDRLILPRGPRDLQRRQLQKENVSEPQNELLEALNSQIQLLQEQLNSSKVSDDKVNEEVSEVIKKETAKQRERINELEKENSILKSKIENSDVLIEQLKQIKIVDNRGSSDYDDSGIEIEDVFIDPIEKDIDPIESHIDIDTSLTLDRKDMSDKANKLKALLGKM